MTILSRECILRTKVTCKIGWWAVLFFKIHKEFTKT